MKKKMNRFFHKMTVLLLIFCLLPAGGTVYAFAGSQNGDTIVIRSAEDLVELASNCRLDTWSQGKKVVLDCDISLENTDFLPIPTFGGQFDGQGHKISGLHLIGSVSPAGVFGIIQEGATVQNLRVSGVVQPGGDQTDVGGICGINYGTIRSCSFQGILEGDENVGGIAGINGLTGMVANCQMGGNLSGEKRTGGIVGYNLGTVSECTNRSYVNTDRVDPALELSEFQSVEELLRTTAEETYNIASDTGGICGYSSGLLLDCTNEGTVGYIHIGYNVGGIAGRSCGHISSCENKGTVYGRKDVGGIAGQMEPYIILKMSSDWVKTLQTEMKTLSAMVNDVAGGLEDSANVLSVHMENLNEGIGTAGQLTRSLAGSLAEYGDEALTEINRTGEILQASAAQLEVISRNGVSVSASLGYALGQLELAVEELEDVSALGTGTMRRVQDAMTDMKAAKSDFSTGAERVYQGMQEIKNGLSDDTALQEEGLEKIQSGLKQMQTGLDAMGGAMKELRTALNGEEILSEDVEAALKSAEAALAVQSDAMKTMAGGVKEIINSEKPDLKEMENGFQSLKKGAESFTAAGKDLQNALKDLEAAFNLLTATSNQMTIALDQMADAANAFQSVAWTMTGLMAEVEELFDYLSSVDPIQIAHADREIADSADKLYGTFTGMQEELSALNGSLNSLASSAADSIQRLNNQFMVVMDVMVGAVYSLQQGETEILEDTSDEDIDRITSGKAYASNNFGTVYGDVNVGGITGTMAVESELDPEDDLKELSSSLNKTYELKCILQNCANYGAVTARKNCAGGGCGKMELGLVTGCGNYGTISSETGNYVGGIAGALSSAVRHSFAKSFLSGGSYVGGIAGAVPKGEAGQIQSCYSMVEITGYDQYAGAVCGGSEGSFSKNYFVSDTLAGVNRVSLDGKAEPISYTKLKKTDGLPPEFLDFTLTFTDGETTVKTVKFDYGSSFTGSVYPDIPEREGYYGVWDRTSLENLKFDTTVTAEYRRYITALESEVSREDGRPVFFAEGQFTEGNALSVKPASAGISDETGTVTEEWLLEIPDDGQETHRLRYLKPDGQDGTVKLSVWEDSQWRSVDCEEFGSYVLFETEGLEVQIKAETAAHSRAFMAAVLIGSCVLAAAIGVICIVLKKKRKKNVKFL